MANRSKTLLLASLSLPSARQLAVAATSRKWKVHTLDGTQNAELSGLRTFYGGTDRAAEYAIRYELCLIEPPLDLLARVPRELLCREVRYGPLGSLADVGGPVFVKPADPVLRCFDAGVYPDLGQVWGRRPIPPQTMVLVSEPVEWTSEMRCFVCEGRVEAWSPYLSFGRPVWKPGCAGAIPQNLVAFCDRLVRSMGSALPPAFVVDVGVLDDGRWDVVEFNPVWCSGILGADVERVLHTLLRASIWMKNATEEDRKWHRLAASA